MKLFSSQVWLIAVLLSGCLAWNSAPAAAQAPADAKAEAKKAPAKPRGRLPAYYNQVVTPQQREKIYALQQTYAEKIEALQAQLKELQAKMDGEVKGVLTAEQIKKLDELAAAAKAKGATPAAGEASEEATTAKPAAAKKP